MHKIRVSRTRQPDCLPRFFRKERHITNILTMFAMKEKPPDNDIACCSEQNSHQIPIDTIKPFFVSTSSYQSLVLEQIFPFLEWLLISISIAISCSSETNNRLDSCSHIGWHVVWHDVFFSSAVTHRVVVLISKFGFYLQTKHTLLLTWLDIEKIESLPTTEQHE